MKSIIRIISDEFNFKKQADELGVRVWQTPSVLFIMMGALIITAMTSFFFVSRNQISPELLVLTETVVIVLIFSIGSFIIKSIEEVAKANKLKSEFISIASHQLKTPITEVNWEIEYLLYEFKDSLNEEQEKIIKAIQKSNLTMAKLVNDLLDIVRIEQGAFSLVKEKIDVMEIIKETIENNMILAKANNVSLDLIESSNIPVVIADKRRIGVVIDNLINNAIKYIGKRGYVKISAKSKGKFITICVEDNGIGIPKTQHDMVFEKFFRSGNDARYTTVGMGLGLYIAKNIVNKSGGKIWFDSQEKAGSTFCFSLPINN